MSGYFQATVLNPKHKPCGQANACELGNEADKWQGRILRDLAIWECSLEARYLYRGILVGGYKRERERAGKKAVKLANKSEPGV